mmetsp:Transcript_22681/g.38127  ORF Transcript_22681/g.38127 Transcript_22681/m.38127 type:complete len:100 (-) Transcript_22681:156-455(-)
MGITHATFTNTETVYIELHDLLLITGMCIAQYPIFVLGFLSCLWGCEKIKNQRTKISEIRAKYSQLQTPAKPIQNWKSHVEIRCCPFRKRHVHESNLTV